MSEKNELECANCQKLRERIKELEAEKEKLQKDKTITTVIICVLSMLVIVRFLISCQG